MADGDGTVRIEFVLDTVKGTVEAIRPLGVVGAQCKDLTAPFERRFGGEKVDTTLPEYYTTEVAKVRATTGGGGGYGV